MLKKIMLASALVAAPAFAQQNTDISGANFQSGTADAALADLGRKAAASGSKLVITAPPDWHGKIAAKVRAGGKADIVLRDGFYENVLVRVQDAADSQVSAEPDRAANADIAKSKAEVAKAKAEAEKMKAEAEKAKAEAEVAKAEAEKAKAEAAAATARAQAQQSVPAAPVAAAPVAKPVAKAPSTDTDAVRSRLERSLNNGRSADGTLEVTSLQSGDALHANGAVIAVTRREGGRRAFYWLDGNLDLRRSELKATGSNQYQVMSLIRGEGTLRPEFQQGSAVLEAREPSADAPQRIALEKNLNNGHAVNGTVSPTSLRNGDVIHVQGDAALVLRRQGKDLSRYWLIGSFDLKQTGVQADGVNKYKVLSDALR